MDAAVTDPYADPDMIPVTGSLYGVTNASVPWLVEALG